MRRLVTTPYQDDLNTAINAAALAASRARIGRARVLYLAQTIWGPSCNVAIEPVTGEKNTRPAEEIAIWEAGLLAVSRRWFATVRPGDNDAIAAVLAREHPIYASHPQTTLAELAQMVTRRPPDHR